jgi:hypothetical protein
MTGQAPLEAYLVTRADVEVGKLLDLEELVLHNLQRLAERFDSLARLGLCSI